MSVVSPCTDITRPGRGTGGGRLLCITRGDPLHQPDPGHGDTGPRVTLVKGGMVTCPACIVSGWESVVSTAASMLELEFRGHVIVTLAEITKLE